MHPHLFPVAVTLRVFTMKEGEAVQGVYPSGRFTTVSQVQEAVLNGLGISKEVADCFSIWLSSAHLRELHACTHIIVPQPCYSYTMHHHVHIAALGALCVLQHYKVLCCNLSYVSSSLLFMTQYSFHPYVGIQSKNTCLLTS